MNIIVDHDPDMQDEYEDIRFKHENTPTNFLSYWIETFDSAEASVWVKIPFVPPGSSMMYLFYGNPDAESESDLYSIFTVDDWEYRWANDEKMSWHYNYEGAWLPDVCSDGNDEFLIAWAEGQGYLPPYTFGYKQEIVADIYDTEGNCLVDDKTVFNDHEMYGVNYYRNENPSMAYGSNGWFFVAWEHYSPKHTQPYNPSRTTIDIYARMVKRSGSNLQLGNDAIIVCNEPDSQSSPNVEYDSVNNRFCVVWEDARYGTNNYNIYGRLYDANGNEIGNEKNICVAGNNQRDPRVAFDPTNEQYMIVWVEEEDTATGPYNIKGGIFSENLNQVSGIIDIAIGDDDTDYIFPYVEFCEEIGYYLVTWNDCDVTQTPGGNRGDVWGKIFDESGYVVVDTFLIKSGEFAHTTIVPYLSSSFFVSFDDDGNAWGKLVSSNGEVFDGDIQLSASMAAEGCRRAVMDVADGRIFVAWEDLRQGYLPEHWDFQPDIYGNIWHFDIPTGSSEVSYVVEGEKKLILEAQITSKEIRPDNLISWYEFGVVFDGSITFDILDATGNTVLIEGASNGEDLSGIDPDDHPGIRLRGHLTRENPSYTPAIDSWTIIYMGFDEDPPETTHINDPAQPNGKNGWYKTNMKIKLEATDGMWGSGVDVTYYQIDDQLPVEYDDTYGIRLPLDATGDQNTPWGEWDVYYFSVDKAGNEEPKKGPFHYKIDKASPHCEIIEPEDQATVSGTEGFWVIAEASDIGSGIDYVGFDWGRPFNPDKNPDDDPPYDWWCDPGFEQTQWRYIIARVYDYAGHSYDHVIYVEFYVKKGFWFLDGSSSSSSSSSSTTTTTSTGTTTSTTTTAATSQSATSTQTNQQFTTTTTTTTTTSSHNDNNDETTNPELSGSQQPVNPPSLFTQLIQRLSERLTSNTQASTPTTTPMFPIIRELLLRLRLIR
jgi:hypothetical protein